MQSNLIKILLKLLSILCLLMTKINCSLEIGVIDEFIEPKVLNDLRLYTQKSNSINDPIKITSCFLTLSKALN